MPIILVLCVVGAFSLANQMYHVAVAIAFGVIGFFMKRCGFPGAPLVLGDHPGANCGKNLDRALQLSKNDWSIFFRRPISVTFLALSVLMIVLSILSAMRENKSSGQSVGKA